MFQLCPILCHLFWVWAPDLLIPQVCTLVVNLATWKPPLPCFECVSISGPILAAPPTLVLIATLVQPWGSSCCACCWATLQGPAWPLCAALWEGSSPVVGPSLVAAMFLSPHPTRHFPRSVLSPTPLSCHELTVFICRTWPSESLDPFPQPISVGLEPDYWALPW